MSKTKFAEKSPLRKSVQPALVVAALILIAYIAYKAYVAIQRGIRYPPARRRLLTVRSSAQETLKKKGFTMEGGKANIKVKGIDEQVYIDKTQAYEASDSHVLTLVALL